MRAAVFTETGGPLSIEDIEPAPPGPRDVVVQLGASGVCHSDLSLKNGYVGIMPGTILGHEGAGTIVEVGKDVIGLAKGDRIIASFIPACGICWFCLHDQSHLCDTEFEIMMKTRGKRTDGTEYTTMTGLGTFAEAMTCDQSSIVKINTSVTDDQLALIGCGVTTGVGAALNTARGAPGRDRRRHRLRRCRPGRHPGRPHRRRVADHRGRPGRDEAQGSRAGPAPPTSSTPTRATRSRRCSSSPAVAASTTRSRSSACPRPRCRRST